MTSKTKAAPAPEDAWDSGELGRDPKFARKAKEIDEAQIDKAAGLVPVSIRLQKSLIDEFRYIAELNGLGYQPLMRQVLTRFAEAEKKKLLREAAHKQRQKIEQEEERRLKRA